MRHVTAFAIGLGLAVATVAAISFALILGAKDARAENGVAQEAQLRAAVMVDGRNVHLGDVFDQAGRHAKKVIAYAPAPGRKLTLEAAWLYRVARAYGVKWRPASRLDQTVVERRSILLDTVRIQDAIRDEARRRAGLSRAANANAFNQDAPESDLRAEKFEVVLDNRIMQIHLPGDMPATLKIRSLTQDARTGRFSALIVAPDLRPGAVRRTVTGAIHRLVQTPVLSRRISSGDIIRKTDIQWVALRSDRITSHVILDEEKLIGMSPKRPIAQGRTIRTGEIRPPVLVKKGSRVTVIFRTPNLKLTTVGRALQNGAKDDIIRIRNLRSKTTIDAMVASSGLVVVTSVGKIALR
jgi:flagellar basal body P-ring formation protein FlgA